MNPLQVCIIFLIGVVIAFVLGILMGTTPEPKTAIADASEFDEDEDDGDDLVFEDIVDVRLVFDVREMSPEEITMKLQRIREALKL